MAVALHIVGSLSRARCLCPLACPSPWFVLFRGVSVRFGSGGFFCFVSGCACFVCLGRVTLPFCLPLSLVDCSTATAAATRSARRPAKTCRCPVHKTSLYSQAMMSGLQLSLSGCVHLPSPSPEPHGTALARVGSHALLEGSPRILGSRGSFDPKSFVRGRKIDPPGSTGRVFDFRCASCGRGHRCRGGVEKGSRVHP
jgi:hypothetical protein